MLGQVGPCVSGVVTEMLKSPQGSGSGALTVVSPEATAPGSSPSPRGSRLWAP